ncbi:bone morphogenetic protein 5-like [Anopheles bellator]|uniref:bone morphogenetic protein 5-like n=1 Tax=Anopheles bellator TaxID=139047 RepID=UPI0026473F33|nr:bone morphogenetic protein 5-like [Anopheles bellator]
MTSRSRSPITAAAGDNKLDMAGNRENDSDGAMLLSLGCKRTLHTPDERMPGKKHFHRYPHHYQHRLRASVTVSKFLWSLLFLVFCDSELVARVLFRSSLQASAAMMIVPAGAAGDSSDEAVPATSGVARARAIVNRTKLLELVMEGLGLTAIPDVRLMNVSQQEYETKYAEYLDRVNRRQELAAAAGDGDDYERRQLFSFPGSDHTLNHRKLRRKRSLNNDYDLVYIRFDISTRNVSTTGEEMSGFQSSPSIHPEDEPEAEEVTPAASKSPAEAATNGHRHRPQSLSELPPISPENIEESSLNIMLIRRQNSARSVNSHSKQQQQQQQQHQHHFHHHPQHQRSRGSQQTPAQHHQQQLRRKGRIKPKQPPGGGGGGGGTAGHGSGPTVTVHVYQLVDPYERHFLTSKTIAVDEIAPNGSRWYQLPLEEAVRTWLDGSRKNLGLELYCEGCHASNLYIVHDSSPFFRSHEETPVLNVVGRLVQREKRSKVQRYRPMLHDYQSPPKTTACKAGNKRCCRHPLLVDFRDIEGFEFIIQPKIFDAGFCRGRCPTKHNPATQHAMLQSLLHEHVKYDVPKPCCAPSSLDHIDILHPDTKNPQRLMVSTWPSMRVLECACS